MSFWAVLSNSETFWAPVCTAIAKNYSVFHTVICLISYPFFFSFSFFFLFLKTVWMHAVSFDCADGGTSPRSSSSGHPAHSASSNTPTHLSTDRPVKPSASPSTAGNTVSKKTAGVGLCCCHWRTRLIAVDFSLVNDIALCSRWSNSNESCLICILSIVNYDARDTVWTLMGLGSLTDFSNCKDELIWQCFYE